MFYEFIQNNSYGYFDVNDKVCHRIIIEADSGSEAIEKAEEIGCYWDGVSKGIDCSCCGDRWSEYYNEIDVKSLQKGYEAFIYTEVYPNYVEEWEKRYGMYQRVTEFSIKNEDESFQSYGCRIAFRDIEEYAQYLSNKYGWTNPDTRIYYKNGEVKEIFTEKR